MCSSIQRMLEVYGLRRWGLRQFWRWGQELRSLVEGLGVTAHGPSRLSEPSQVLHFGTRGG